jgi:hypothetical protein
LQPITIKSDAPKEGTSILLYERIDNGKIKNKIPGLLILVLFFTVSCSTIKAGIYLSSIDPKDLEAALVKEADVKIFLEQIYEYPKNYTITAYTRTAIKSSIAKSETYIHAYYVIHYNISSVGGVICTLSFNGTKFSRYSQGVWALNTKSDLESYNKFLEGDNIWAVEMIKPENQINVEQTIFNVLRKMDGHIAYYYKDHLNNKLNMDNCITALKETLIEKK